MAALKSMAGRLPAWFQGLEYRRKLLVSILTLTLAPILILSGIGLAAYAQVTTDKLVAQESERLADEAERMDKLFYSGIQKSVYLTNNLLVLQMLRQDYEDDLLGFLQNNDNVKAVMEALRSDALQSDIAIYGYNPSLYRTETIKRIEDLGPDVTRRVLDNKEAYPVRDFRTSPSNGRLEAHIYSKIDDLAQTLAITEVVVPLDESVRALGGLLPPDSFILYRLKDGSVFPIGYRGVEAAAAERAEARYRAEGAAPGYYAVPVHLKSAQDDLVLFVGKRAVMAQLAVKLAGPLSVLVGLLLTVYFVIKLVAYLLTRRLAALMHTIRGETGALESFAAEPAARSDELGQLDRTFHELVVQIRDHYRREADYEVGRRLLETELLQVNINPHVLYNTLSAIKWEYPDERLGRLVDEMVDFYRLFLNRGEAAAPLAQELEMVRKYMDIHRFSYESDFAYAIDAEEEARGALVLRNMLQPIVENGIVHGIGPLGSGGRIAIAARRKGETIEIEVSDNGAGLDPALAERLEGALRAPPAGGGTRGSGYALFNIQRRLKLYYGDEYGLRLGRSAEGGASVTLVVPYRTGS